VKTAQKWNKKPNDFGKYSRRGKKWAVMDQPDGIGIRRKQRLKIV